MESATKGTYVAKAAGTGLKAVLTIVSGTKDSATYIINAGAITYANIVFKTTSFSASKGTSAVTLTLKDSNNNPITGKSSDEIAKSFAFTKMLGSAATNLTNDDAVGSLSGWSESSDGVYTSTYSPGKQTKPSAAFTALPLRNGDQYWFKTDQRRTPRDQL